jgi:hypothetical protein
VHTHIQCDASFRFMGVLLETRSLGQETKPATREQNAPL